MAKITGSCLSKEVSYQADADPLFMANCHCSDCRQASGAAYATLVFVPTDKVTIKGDLQKFFHTADRGTVLEKIFCGNCGSQIFSSNNAYPERIGSNAGNIHQSDIIQPQLNVYCSSKIASTPLDENLPAHDKMPG